MELIVNFSLRDDSHGRATTVETLHIRDLYSKEPEEVVEQITEELENAISMVYSELKLSVDE